MTHFKRKKGALKKKGVGTGVEKNTPKKGGNAKELEGAQTAKKRGFFVKSGARRF